MLNLKSYKLSMILVLAFVCIHFVAWVPKKAIMNFPPHLMNLEQVVITIVEIFLIAMSAAALIFWGTKKTTSFATALNIALVTLIVYNVIEELIVIAAIAYNHF